MKQLYPKKRSYVEKILGVGSSKKWHIELMKPSLQFPQRPKNQHGTYSQTPEDHLDKEILSVIRNPYDKFISTYEYRYWLKHRPSAVILKRAGIENLESITIDDFAKIQIASVNTRFDNLEKLEIGSQTIQFIFMFFKEPERVVQNLSEDYFKEKRYIADMPEITLLNQANLTQELFAYLEKFHPNQEAFNEAKSISNVNVNKNRKKVDDFSWTELSIEYVSHYERYLLEILEEHGFQFKKPAKQ